MNIFEAVNSWNKVEAGEKKPLSRYHHTAVVFEDSMWIFGGLGDSGAFNDLCEYNFSKFFQFC